MEGRDLLIFLGGIWLVTLLLCGLLVAAAIHDDRDWDAFSSQHHCAVIGYMRGDAVTSLGVAANGQPAISVGSTPSKTGWKCDDGLIYWR